MFDIVSEFIFFENKNKNENSVLRLLYFEFKYIFSIILCIMYSKIENNNMRSVNIIENDKPENMCSVVLFSKLIFTKHLSHT